MNEQEALQTQKKPAASWVEILERNKEAFAQALPSVGLTPERVIRTALTAMRQNPELTKCEPKSVVASILQACELGLSVSNTLGHCYLVPFNNTKKGIKECTMIIGYRGFTQLAIRSEKVNPIQTFIVYEKEPFALIGGSFPRIEHTPLPPTTRGEKKIGVYAVASLKDGGSVYAFLWADEVEAIKKRSRAGASGPWITDPDEMWKKTAIRRLAKMLPLSTDFQKAAVIDEYNEAGIVASDMIMTEEMPQVEDTVKPAIEQVKEPEPGQKKEIEGNGKDLRTEIIRMLMEVTGNSNVAAEKLKELSGFQGKNKDTGEIKWIEGKENPADLSDAAVKVTYGKVKKYYEEWKGAQNNEAA